jgi:hypothetical protein
MIAAAFFLLLLDLKQFSVYTYAFLLQTLTYLLSGSILSQHRNRNTYPMDRIGLELLRRNWP